MGPADNGQWSNNDINSGRKKIVWRSLVLAWLGICMYNVQTAKIVARRLLIIYWWH
jgi:hypothetical protein